MQKNKKGFTVLELLLVIILIIILLVTTNLVLHKINPYDVRNGFKDNPDCAAFNNYALDNFSLPSDYRLETRIYTECGNYFTTVQGNEQTLSLGYRSDVHYSDLEKLISNLKSALVQKGWQPIDDASSPYMLSAKYKQLTADFNFLTYDPVVFGVHIKADSHNDAPATNKPSPPQIIMSDEKALTTAPFGVYTPNGNKDFTHDSGHAGILVDDLDYYLISYGPDYSGLVAKTTYTISYSNHQIVKYDNCIYSSGGCPLWYKTPKGTEVYSHFGDDLNLPNIHNDVFVRLGDTDLHITFNWKGRGAISKKAVISSTIDSLQRVN